VRVGTHAAGVLSLGIHAILILSKHARGVRTRQINLSYKSAGFAVTETDLTFHRLSQLANNIQADPAAAAARMANEKLAQLGLVTLKAAPVINHDHRDSAAGVAYRYFYLGRVPMDHRVLYQVRQHTFEGARIRHHHPVTSERDRHV